MGNRLILFLTCLLACKKAGPVIEPLVPSAVDDTWSQASLDRWTDELVPLIEQHAERKFTARPVVEVFDGNAFKAYIAKESKLIMDVIYRDTPEAIRNKAAERSAAVEIRGLFGKYGLYDGKTYIVPESIEAAGAELGDDGPERLAKIVLAHELAHALQNQEYDGREQLPNLVDLDHFQSWGCVSEGGANFIALRVAADLGLEEEFWLLSSHQGWGKEGLESPGAYEIWMRYGHGMRMLESVVEQGGMDAYWQWHAVPPVSSSMLFRPETYATDLPPRALPYEEVLRGTEQSLTQGEWMTSNTRLGEYALRGDAIRTGKEDEFEPILSHLLDAQHLDLEMPGRQGDIRILAFDGPEHARAYLTLLRAEQTVEGQTLAKMLGVTVEVTYSELSEVEGDGSLLRTQRIPLGQGYAETRTAWVVRGSDIVSVEASKFRPGLRLANTINAVFQQLDQTRE